MKKLLSMTIALVLGLTGTSIAELSDEDVATIAAVCDIWEAAAIEQDWNMLMELHTHDAILLPPNAPAVEGQEAIRDYFASFPPMSKVRLQIEEIDGDGDLAFVRGSYTLTMTPPDEDTKTDKGKFLEIRKRQADGSWPIYRDSYNSDLAEELDSAEDSASADEASEDGVVEIGCARCTFNMLGATSCKTAINIEGTPYLVSGGYLDAREAGLCNLQPHKARVSGEFENDTFIPSSIALVTGD